jgi:hypothetical protein
MLPRLPMSHREWALIGVLLLVIAGAGVLAKAGSNQWVNMGAASRHIKGLNRQLAAYPEFQHVKCGVMTADDGGMLVVGEVANYEQRRRLRSLVSQSKPPTNWRF